MTDSQRPARKRKGRQTIEEQRVDAHVGAQVRLRRKLLGLSQTALANQLGVAFQQVQKYERGVNRISASMLFEISRTLDAPIAYFFDGIAGRDSDATADAPLNAEAIRLMTAFGGIPDPDIRRSLLALARSVAGDDAVPDEA